ncbi:MAG: hypothetical protein ACRDDY_05385 [Clostridium sp.]|uniref:hypothetical protein n=1 Tax=Clostridium sp. TaxID=1506 RepID=UPI003EE52ED6
MFTLHTVTARTYGVSPTRFADDIFNRIIYKPVLSLRHSDVTKFSTMIVVYDIRRPSTLQKLLPKDLAAEIFHKLTKCDFDEAKKACDDDVGLNGISKRTISQISYLSKMHDNKYSDLFIYGDDQPFVSEVWKGIRIMPLAIGSPSNNIDPTVCDMMVYSPVLFNIEHSRELASEHDNCIVHGVDYGIGSLTSLMSIYRWSTTCAGVVGSNGTVLQNAVTSRDLAATVFL